LRRAGGVALGPNCRGGDSFVLVSSFSATAFIAYDEYPVRIGQTGAIRTPMKLHCNYLQ